MKTVVAFDLDDTLFKEADFLESSYRCIARQLSNKYSRLNYHDCLDKMFHSDNAFDSIIDYLSQYVTDHDETVAWCIETYRTHIPDISLSTDTTTLLEALQRKHTDMAIITDGRINTQTNKMHALRLTRFVPEERIFISDAIGFDKTHPQAFTLLMNQYTDNTGFCYIGDNPAKDFYWPNRMGWKTFCLMDNTGRNVHRQDFNLPDLYLPQHKINNLSEILLQI